ncbi:MAG: TIGR03560 family F420-dependent LLM class oxidoreductase [Chloroflexota bacterium]|nr:TIGR03560 family F420-dependent LLM class oxidoreductase [Chloroflexota bacterium]MDE2910939.1 TIGR03560 family F420-dependent LLM class oxidoreductase [Chloroflexota bacterium]
MTQIGIMIEGSRGLNWTRWKGLLRTAEDCGFQSVFRSDHFTNPAGEDDQDSLELWMSLAYAASHTESIEFGSLVAPVSFRHPSMQARYAAAIDDLSAGRLVLGMGAGWQAREHQRFGLPFYDFATRYQMLEEALQVTKRLLRSDTPFDFIGEHYQLEDAILLPRPARPGGPPILIGGNGPKRTLPLVAKHADEWNADALDLVTYRARRAILDEYLSAEGRAVDALKYSLMTRVIYRRTQAQLDAFLHESGISKDEVAAGRLIVGTAGEVIDQMAARFEAGINRIMLRWLELDDMANLELLAHDVLPQF